MKIGFKLAQEDGFPPIAVERLNADPIGNGKFKIKNTPFFTQEAAYGDIVSGEEDESGDLLFCSNEEYSGFDAIAIILQADTQDIFLMDLVRRMNCIIEYGEFGAIRMTALGVPPDMSRNNALAIRSQLDFLEEQGHLSYAELVVNP